MLDSVAMVMVTGRLHPRRSVDQRARIVDEMLFAQFSVKHLGQRDDSDREGSDVLSRLLGACCVTSISLTLLLTPLRFPV